MDEMYVEVVDKEYDFLCLLLSVRRLNNDKVIVNFTKLAKDLFTYSQNKEYKPLFKDITDCINEDKEYIEIRKSIEKANKNGFIELTPDGTDDTIGINMVLDDEAELLVRDAGEEKFNLMNKIVQELKAKNDTKKPYTMHPIKHNEESNK
ncbi:MAG: hypothetical protein IKP98_03080 [Bacilli bacterium]|nr:hypothetical protein [Bacilli bacterium]